MFRSRRPPSSSGAPAAAPWPPEWSIGLLHDLEDHAVLWNLREVPIAEVAPFLTWAPPGHFYSPIPSLAEFERRADTLFDPRPEIPGIDLRLDAQRRLLGALAAFADYQPPAAAEPGWRYYADNTQYGIGDATVLQAMMRHAKPSRVVEIGSGFSSAVMLDTADRHLHGTQFTFVEPYPDRLNALLSDADRARVTIHEQPVQDVPVEIVDQLGADDLLFIDSSHVAKVGSDVNHELFELLPRLAPGVVVHVHDIAYPFENPAGWVREGRAWNEVYLLRAFLQHNSAFEIVLFNDALANLARADLFAALPQVEANTGLSIWLRRVE